MHRSDSHRIKHSIVVNNNTLKVPNNVWTLPWRLSSTRSVPLFLYQHTRPCCCNTSLPIPAPAPCWTFASVTCCVVDRATLVYCTRLFCYRPGKICAGINTGVSGRLYWHCGVARKSLVALWRQRKRHIRKKRKNWWLVSNVCTGHRNGECGNNEPRVHLLVYYRRAHDCAVSILLEWVVCMVWTHTHQPSNRCMYVRTNLCTAMMNHARHCHCHCHHYYKYYCK